MGLTDIISLAITGINLLTKSIDAANAGDLATAQANLAAARDHFAKAVAAWEAAQGPSA